MLCILGNSTTFSLLYVVTSRLLFVQEIKGGEDLTMSPSLYIILENRFASHLESTIWDHFNMNI